MFSFGSLSSTKTSKVKIQRNNHQYKMLGPIGARLLSILSVCLLANRSATNVVNAVNQDKVSFQIFEIDGPLLDIMWCGNTNEVILVQSEMGTIYRSRDRGDSWKKLKSMMHQTGMGVIDEGQTVSSLFLITIFHCSCMVIYCKQNLSSEEIFHGIYGLALI